MGLAQAVRAGSIALLEDQCRAENGYEQDTRGGKGAASGILLTGIIARFGRLCCIVADVGCNGGIAGFIGSIGSIGRIGGRVTGRYRARARCRDYLGLDRAANDANALALALGSLGRLGHDLPIAENMIRGCTLCAAEVAFIIANAVIFMSDRPYLTALIAGGIAIVIISMRGLARGLAALIADGITIVRVAVSAGGIDRSADRALLVTYGIIDMKGIVLLLRAAGACVPVTYGIARERAGPLMGMSACGNEDSIADKADLIRGIGSRRTGGMLGRFDSLIYP